MPWSDADVAALAAHCRDVLPLAQAAPEPFYHSLPLCILDVIFSVNARYEAASNVVRRYADCRHVPLMRQGAQPPADQVTLSAFLTDYERHGIDGMAVNILHNRQRTSPRGGILKAEAALWFATVLHGAGIETFEDAQGRRDDLVRTPRSHLAAALCAVPGQTSGVSVYYLAMQLGEENTVKPDRMLHRFVAAALGRSLAGEELQGLFRAVCDLLRSAFPRLTPVLLDGAVWKWQRRHAADCAQRRSSPMQG